MAYEQVHYQVESANPPEKEWIERVTKVVQTTGLPFASVVVFYEPDVKQFRTSFSFFGPKLKKDFESLKVEVNTAFRLIKPTIEGWPE